MYCLDSDIIISVFRGDKKLKKRVDLLKPENIAITTITLCELFRGAYKSKDAKSSLFLVYELLINYKVFSLDAKSSEIFGADYAGLEKKGKQTQALDLMTASIAKSNGLVLVTRNKKHFENIPDLEFEEW